MTNAAEAVSSAISLRHAGFRDMSTGSAGALVPTTFGSGKKRRSPSVNRGSKIAGHRFLTVSGALQAAARRSRRPA